MFALCLEGVLFVCRHCMFAYSRCLCVGRYYVYSLCLCEGMFGEPIDVVWKSGKTGAANAPKDVYVPPGTPTSVKSGS